MLIQWMLLDLLKREAYREGTFTLASGKQSDFYINCKDALLTADGHYWTGSVFFSFITEQLKCKPKAVAGVVLGGCPIASAVAQQSVMRSQFYKLNTLFVRKEAKDHGTKSLVEGTKLVPLGSNVVLLEDVTTTGGSSLGAIKILRETGYEVTDTIVLVDRLEGAKEALAQENVVLHSIFTRSDFVKNDQ